MRGVCAVSDSQVCEELLRDIICYEMCRGHLSSEVQYLLQRHLTQCPECRRRMRGFMTLVQDVTAIRNYG